MIYTAKKIADMLGRPATTIRTWGEKYREYIPLGDKVSGRRQYNEESVEVFRKIEELQNKGLIKSEVVEELKKDFPLHMDGDEQEVQTSGLVQYQQYNDMLNYFRTGFEKYDELIKLQREEIHELKEQTTLLKTALGLNRSDTIKSQKKTSRTPRVNATGLKGTAKKTSFPTPKKRKPVSKKPQSKTGKKKSKTWLDIMLGR